MTDPKKRIVTSVASTAFTASVFVLACATRESHVAESRSRVVAVSAPLDSLDGTAYETAMRVKLPKTPPQEDPGLHNVFRLGPTIVSGSEPHGEAAFAKLQSMGIRTVLSVDGAEPEKDLAAKYGLGYVHVPIQYKGISDDEMTKIAKTFREKEGPFYVHCFHGKHRGPAAAEIGRIVLDGIPRDQAIAEMRQWCGTAQSYEGLYRTIATAAIPTAKQTSAYAWSFPSGQPIEGFRHAMVEISRSDDNLKALSKRQWKSDPEHPDLDAFNESVKVAKTLDRALQLEDVAARPPEFRKWLDESAKASVTLRDALAAFKEGKGTQDAVDGAYKRMTSACNACHDVYRN